MQVRSGQNRMLPQHAFHAVCEPFVFFPDALGSTGCQFPIQLSGACKFATRQLPAVTHVKGQKIDGILNKLRGDCHLGSARNAVEIKGQIDSFGDMLPQIVKGRRGPSGRSGQHLFFASNLQQGLGDELGQRHFPAVSDFMNNVKRSGVVGEIHSGLPAFFCRDKQAVTGFAPGVVGVVSLCGKLLGQTLHAKTGHPIVVDVRILDGNVQDFSQPIEVSSALPGLDKGVLLRVCKGIRGNLLGSLKSPRAGGLFGSQVLVEYPHIGPQDTNKVGVGLQYSRKGQFQVVDFGLKLNPVLFGHVGVPEHFLRSLNTGLETRHA